MSCNSDDSTEITNTDLVGKWNWTNTDGGVGDNIHETPENTGKTIHLILTDNYHFSIEENGNETLNGTYELSLKESIYSGGFERFITLQTIDQLYDGFVNNGIVSVQQSTILKIADNNPDGLESGFEKME